MRAGGRPSYLRDFHDLMRYRIMDILLVASPYDAFLLEEAGQLSERVLGEFRNLDLHYGPGITTVSTGAEALAQARAERRFDLVISTLQLRDMTGAELAQRVREAGLDIPVVLLAFDTRELKDFLARRDVSAVERVFLWQGDARILLGIVKSVEDWRNVAHDTQTLGVQVILLVEDSVRYYSSFLPAIYAELLQHSQRLIHDGANLSAEDHADAGAAQDPALQLLRGGVGGLRPVPGAPPGDRSPTWSSRRRGDGPRRRGWSSPAEVRERWPDVPVILQSSRPENAALARAAGADFLLKGSPRLLGDLRRFMLADFGFGDFVFRLPDGTEVGRAQDLKGLEEQLRTVPAESVAYHGARNHFSRWLKARTEFALAHELRPRKASDVRLRGGPAPEHRRIPWTVTGGRGRGRWWPTSNRDDFDASARLLPPRRRLPGRKGPRPRLPAPASRRERPRPRAARGGCGSAPLRGGGHRRVRLLPRRATISASSPSTPRTTRRSSVAFSPPVSPKKRSASCSPCSSTSASRWRCDPRASSRTRSTSRSRASTQTLHAAEQRRPERGPALAGWSRRSSASMPRPSRAGPRPTSAPRPTGWRRRRWP